MSEIVGFARSAPLRWTDLLDILIVSVAIYESLKLIRGTGAVQMAVGSSLIVVLFYASVYLELDTVNWLIRNLVGFVVFAAIVLFQGDIRRALSHFGRTPFIRYFTRPEQQEDHVDEIVDAAMTLAHQRTGAIIVLEREVGLRNYIESGIPLDATLTYDLLVTIFIPSSPLHDGAAIVQGDRVAAASCFLPLTVQPGLSGEMGTRHRAAIGLTEENDALAIVVSEERGTVSLALDGTIERDLDEKRLRARLRELTAELQSTGSEPAGEPARQT